MEIKLKTLTPIWTGGVDGNMDRIHETGILGSLRWWYEVLVRGLKGAACDPSNSSCDGKKHCVACELFGCTSWARKFRFQLIGNDDRPYIKQLNANDEFTMRFIPLRPIQDEEWALLDLTVRLIADFGAIGGKTIYKPTDEINRQKEKHHKDYGLIKIISSDLLKYKINQKTLKNYLDNSQWNKEINQNDFMWASLDNFWCVEGKYLARQDEKNSTFNKIIGRPETKLDSSGNDNWLSGEQMVSKKVFSFKTTSPRTFGFFKRNEICINDIKTLLNQAWPNLKGNELIYGDLIINQLFIRQEQSS